MFDTKEQRIAAMGDIVFPELPFPDNVITLSDRAQLLGIYYPFFVEELNTTIHTAISTALGITVIWDSPGQIRPAIPYATIKLSPSRDICPADISYKQLDQYTYTFRKEMTLTVNIYDDSSCVSLMDTLLANIETQVFQKILRQGNIAFLYNNAPIPLDKLLETQFEHRTEIEIFLSHAMQLDEDISEIHTVDYEGTFGNITIDDSVDIS